MSGSGLKALPDVQEWSGYPPRCPGVVGSPYGCTEVVGKPSGMFRSDREALSNVRQWSGDFSGCLAMVERPTRMSSSGWETLPDVPEW